MTSSLRRLALRTQSQLLARFDQADAPGLDLHSKLLIDRLKFQFHQTPFYSLFWSLDALSPQLTQILSHQHSERPLHQVTLKNIDR
jgi:hypothetical protein